MRSIGTDQDKHFPLALTPRERKGLQFESYVARKLEGLAIPYKRQSSLVDFVLPYGVQLEAKFSHAIIYPCWIRRDWITRFTPEAKLKLVITNRGIKLTEKSKQLLKENNIYLIYYDEDKKLKSLYEWLRFLFEGRREGVTSLIEANIENKVYSVYSHCTVLNLGYTKPSPASTQSVKIGHLHEETLNVRVKLCDWIGKLASYGLKLLKSLLIHPLKLGKRFSQQGMVDRVSIDGRRLNLPNCKQTKQEVVKYEYEKIGIKDKSSHRKGNTSSN